ncbi:acetylxylan esterase [Membranicola marinus]|uniref:Acetylxylan esterase n=1 Tax=Membranihabitans marinus TaxID=1227546 RepID=A0A953HJT0_9BACT|nr:acetylxylan esterase [Membranihabitans marinus]MBY5957174.1 acetylxylan esterase [Membranihabitans marinus]
MKLIYLVLFFFVLYFTPAGTQVPNVFSKQQPDLIQSGLNHRAALAYKTHQMPHNLEAWEERKAELRAFITSKTGARKYSDLPLEYQETGQHQSDGVTVKNIYFQTRPGVFTTANLYIPAGDGPFPAVITMMGHSRNGRLYEVYQAIGQALAKHGYVSLHMDPWGAGERTTTHGDFEYHGAHLGASLFNIGESLLGMQITDNRRGVDLLSSLPFVDSELIGATGASGGGNQTMWLAAMDDRIKAAMPVVSVGTFQSYIMASNCVCETLIDGLTFTEESEVLGMIAPRALKLVNAGQEKNKAFIPSEMQRSFRHAEAIFDLYQAKSQLDSQVIDMTHGYHPEARKTLVGWMDKHLKNIGNGAPRSERDISLLTSGELMTFDRGNRSARVTSTVEYCSLIGRELKDSQHGQGPMNISHEKEKLTRLLKIPENVKLRKSHSYGEQKGWTRYALEVTDDYLIPVLIRKSSRNPGEYVLIAHHKGKAMVPEEVLQDYQSDGKGIVLVDFWGLGENSSEVATRLNGSSLPAFHTLSRSLIWLGETMQGRWVQEMEMVYRWLRESHHANRIDIHAFKDLGPATLFYAALDDQVGQITMEDAPISYLFDDGVAENYYSMAIHVPGILKWGDLLLAAAMTGANVQVRNPRTISGKKYGMAESNELIKEYEYFRSGFETGGSLEIER